MMKRSSSKKTETRGGRGGERGSDRGGDRERGTSYSDLGPLLRKGAKYLEGVKTFDYKDSELLRKFMTERGKLMPRRISGTSAKQQRQIKRAIRRARVMGLLP
jgi:small subunit ribosomal protein S18